MTPEYLQALGKITTSFETLDFVLTGTLGSLVRSNTEEFWAVASPLLFNRKVETFAAIIKMRLDKKGDPEAATLQKAQAMVSKLRNLNERRNHYIHAMLAFGSNGEVVRMKFSGYRQTIESVTPEILNGLAQEITEAWLELSRLFRPDLEIVSDIE